ncbi:hypothetical protein [Fimbriiglobus ruber]|uniref:hypothetical protein n=1 Tax=Fimbriiglobus ruber TaxID=1908690 RepID=UPI001179FB99|nr:hypothetical protein [Fimbriiglobus ruber]
MPRRIHDQANQPAGQRHGKALAEAGAEAILQIRADLLSETEPLAAFWVRLQENQTSERI